MARIKKCRDDSRHSSQDWPRHVSGVILTAPGDARRKRRIVPLYDVSMRFLLPMLMLLPLCAQEPQGPPPGAKAAPHVPKNLQLLKPEDIRDTMRAFRTALGVECTFCHVQGDFASDEKHTKLVARKMILLVRSINPQFPDGKEHVTCYTCHRGAEEPVMAPPAAQ
jgi:hypothetical protein